MNRRPQTLALGAIPLLALTALTSIDHIPGTTVSLTVPYAAEGAGPTFDTLGKYDGVEVVEINGADVDETSGELHMTTVSVRTGMTLTQALSRWLFTQDTLVPIEEIFPPHMTEEEVNESNQQAFANSEASATLAAMHYLSLPVTTKVAELVPDSPAESALQVGDELVAVDGTTATGPSQLRELIRAHSPGDEIVLSIRRDGQVLDKTITLAEHERDKVAYLGVSMQAVPGDGIDVEYHLEDIGGPSAGMIFSLAVVDKLSPGELTAGKRIAGTGTIDDTGEVGPIGGIAHKIDGARQSGAELFLAPTKNCEEARSADAGSMTIAAVDSLEEAIQSIQAWSQGKEIRTCASVSN